MQNTLSQRLHEIAKKVGGKRALSSASGVSEAQLFRYLKGSSEPTVSKIIAMAEAAKVCPSWLITGEGESNAASWDSNEKTLLNANNSHLKQLIKTFEEALVEYQYNFSPEQKSVLIPFMQQAFTQELGKQVPTKEDMLHIFHFLENIKDIPTLKLMANVHKYVEQEGKEPFGDDAASFVNAMCRGNIGYFNGPMGRLHFEKMSSNLNLMQRETFNKFLPRMFEHFSDKQGIRFLDIGCGNGRHLKYLAKNYPQIKLKGIDASNLSIHLCRRAELAGHIPQGTVEPADARMLPFPNESFEVLNCLSVLHFIPALMEEKLGAHQVLSEANRVLCSKGMLHIVARSGDGIEMLPFDQLYNSDMLSRLADDTGFDLIWSEQHGINVKDHYAVDQPNQLKYLQRIQAILIKR